MILAYSPNEYEVITPFFHGKPPKGDPATRAAYVVYFDFPKSWLKRLRFSLKRHLFKFLEKDNFNVIICNRLKPVSIVMQLSFKLAAEVCIGIFHATGEHDQWRRRIGLRFFVSKKWAFVSVSSAVQKHLTDLRCGFTEKNTVAMNNAIDLENACACFLPAEEARQAPKLPL